MLMSLYVISKLGSQKLYNFEFVQQKKKNLWNETFKFIERLTSFRCHFKTGDDDNYGN